MKAKIDLYKFVRSLMERYYDKIHIDRTTTECWLDKVLEDQGLEYKDGEIVEIKQEQPFNKERLMEVAKPETLEEKVEHWQRMRDIAMEKIKGEFKEEDSPETKAIKEQIESLKKRIEDNQLGCVVQRLDKIIELLQSAILILPNEEPRKSPFDPPYTVTCASVFGSDYDIDTQKIQEDELNKPKS